MLEVRVVYPKQSEHKRIDSSNHEKKKKKIPEIKIKYALKSKQKHEKGIPAYTGTREKMSPAL